jgi:hypothetical protein
MPTDRIFVEQCLVISANDIPGNLPKSDSPFATTTLSIPASCPTCGTSRQLEFEAMRTRQGKRLLCPKCRRPVNKLYLPPGSGIGAARIVTDWFTRRSIESGQPMRSTDSEVSEASF